MKFFSSFHHSIAIALFYLLEVNLSLANGTMVPKVITSVRSACVEVLVDRQLRRS